MPALRLGRVSIAQRLTHLLRAQGAEACPPQYDGMQANVVTAHAWLLMQASLGLGGQCLTKYVHRVGTKDCCSHTA